MGQISFRKRETTLGISLEEEHWKLEVYNIIGSTGVCFRSRKFFQSLENQQIRRPEPESLPSGPVSSDGKLSPPLSAEVMPPADARASPASCSVALSRYHAGASHQVSLGKALPRLPACTSGEAEMLMKHSLTAVLHLHSNRQVGVWWEWHLLLGECGSFLARSPTHLKNVNGGI